MTQPPRVAAPSLSGRIALVILLTVGFYVLALGLAAALILIPYGLFVSTHEIYARVDIFCLATAVVILYSIAPRIDRFTPPGPVLTEAEQPRLFGLIRKIAAATDQAMPKAVYLVPDLNAWVANRGGVLGIGSRRIMGLGLPAFEALSTSQLAAVLAHEFGHYHHGDTALGPWIYKVRQAMARTLESLSKRRNIMAAPFNAYGKLFMRLTTAVSRRQELGADALAARIAGPAALRTGLERLHATAPVMDGYWSNEVLPVLASGRRPPIMRGFSQFLNAPKVREAAEQLLEVTKSQADDPFATHPSLATRLAAITDVQEAPELGLDNDAPASALLDGLPDLEERLLDHMGQDMPPLEFIEWGEVGQAVWVPIWEQYASEHAQRLAGMKPGDLAAAAADQRWLAVRLGFAVRPEVTSPASLVEAATAFGSALCVLLVRKGWTLSAKLGEDVTLERNGVRIQPFTALRDLASGEMLPGEWADLCERAGVADEDLGAVGRNPDPAGPTRTGLS